jgi:hypothetical protein
MAYNSVQQRKAAKLGIGLDPTTKWRHDKESLELYEQVLGEFIGKKLGIINGGLAKFMCIVLADDFTRMWFKTFWKSGGDRNKKLTWINNCVLPVNHPAVFDVDQKSINKGPLSVDDTVAEVEKNVNYVSAPLEVIMEKKPHLFSSMLAQPSQITTTPTAPVSNNHVSSSQLTSVYQHYTAIHSPTSPTARHINHPYYFSSEANNFRERVTLYSQADQDCYDLKSLALVKLIERPFHSNADSCVSILTTMTAPHMFKNLRHGLVCFNPGDLPAYRTARNILRQGVLQSPKHLASLLEMSSKELFAKLVSIAKLDGVSDADMYDEIGKAAMNIRPELGVLHIKINPIKDIFRAWFDQLFNPVYCAAHKGKKLMNANPSMREMLHMVECMYAAYHVIRPQVRQLLLPLCSLNRPDAGGFLHLFEWSMTMACVNYDTFFRTNQLELYYDLLNYSAVDAYMKNRKNYKYALLLKIENMVWLRANHAEVFHALCRTRFADERKIEEANAILATHLRARGQGNGDDTTCADDMTKIFCARMKAGNLDSLVSKIIPSYKHSYGILCYYYIKYILSSILFIKVAVAQCMK